MVEWHVRMCVCTYVRMSVCMSSEPSRSPPSFSPRYYQTIPGRDYLGFMCLLVCIIVFVYMCFCACLNLLLKRPFFLALSFSSHSPSSPLPLSPYHRSPTSRSANPPTLARGKSPISLTGGAPSRAAPGPSEAVIAC